MIDVSTDNTAGNAAGTAATAPDAPAAVALAAEEQITRTIEELDHAKPLSHPLLWAAHCSLHAATLLLRAKRSVETSTDPSAERDREILLEAVAQSRAAVGAANFAAEQYAGRLPSRRALNEDASPA